MNKIFWTTITDYHDAPTTTGVYEYLKNGEIIYIGKASNLKSRLATHAQTARLDEHERLITSADTIRYCQTDTEFKALLLEASLIQEYLPKYNRALRDDKSYLYIVINPNDEFPKPQLARARDLNLKQSSKYLRIFGPFPGARIALEVLKIIRRLIPFCQQKKLGNRGCFYSKIGLCHPCPNTIHTEGDKKLYRRQVFQVIKVLEGKIDPVIKDLENELDRLNQPETYEQALILRDKINRFKSTMVNHTFSDRRIISLSSADEDISSLHKVLKPYFPALNSLARIECFDASTFAFRHSVVSMVVSTNGLPDKGEYKRFRIKNPRASSDFEMLEEALTRRFKNKNWPTPDLIVIDGGRPQLRRLQRVLDQLESPPPMVGIAKHPDKLVIPTVEGFTTVILSRNSGALRLLERLRDEAHRFGNLYRKVLMKKKSRL